MDAAPSDGGFPGSGPCHHHGMPFRVGARGPAATSSSRDGWAAPVDIGLVEMVTDDDAVARAESLLAPAEVDRARRGTPEVHRRRVLLRAALRSALGNELGIDPREVPLETSPGGRPYVATARGRVPLDVSCSASGALGIVAMGHDCRVGIDIEGVAPWSPDVLDERWLSRSEQLALSRLPLAARPRAVTRCWTQKEAVLKARGTGLTDDPARTLTPVGQDGGIVSGWRLLDVEVPDGWLASLAVGPEGRLS